MTIVSPIPAKPVLTALARNTKGALKSRFKIRVDHGQALSFVADMFGCASSNALLARAATQDIVQVAAPAAPSTKENQNDEGLLLQLTHIVNNLSDEAIYRLALNHLRNDTPSGVEDVTLQAMLPVQNAAVDDLLKEFCNIINPYNAGANPWPIDHWRLVLKLVRVQSEHEQILSLQQMLRQAAVASFQHLQRNFPFNEWVDPTDKTQQACIAALQNLPPANIQRPLQAGDFVVRLNDPDRLIGRIIEIGSDNICQVAKVGSNGRLPVLKISKETTPISMDELLGFEIESPIPTDSTEKTPLFATVYLDTPVGVIGKIQQFDVSAYFATLTDDALLNICYLTDVSQFASTADLHAIAEHQNKIGKFPGLNKLKQVNKNLEKSLPGAMISMVFYLNNNSFKEWATATRPHLDFIH